MNAPIGSVVLTADFASVLFDVAWKSTALLVIAGAVLRGGSRWSAAARHFGCVVVFGGLLALPLLSWMLPRLAVLPHWLETPAPAAALAARSPRPEQPTAIATHTAAQAEATPATSPASGGRAPATPPAATEAPAHAATPPGGIGRWVPVAWVVGFFCALAPAAAGLLSLGRLQRTSHCETTGPLAETLRRLSADLGLRRPVQLLVTARRAMPMTWGFWRPKILLPAEARHWSDERRRVVLRHELAHLRRGDFLTTLAVRGVCALYWFNPLVWFAGRRLRLEQEQACDDAVLAAGERPTGYAEEMLRIAAGGGPRGLETLGALSMARPSTLEERLRAILDGTRNRATPARIGILATLAAALLGLVPLAMLRAAQAAPGASATTGPIAGAERGLIAWWRAEGNGRDSVGTHHGEFPFGIRYLPGPTGLAFDFRRSYAIQDLLPRVSIPDSPDFQLAETLTLEARIYPLGFGGIVLIRGDDRPGLDNWQVDLSTPGKISFNFDSADNQSAELLAPIALEKWQHVIITFERGAMKIYIDGQLAASGQTALRPNTALDPQHMPALGIGNTGGTVYNIPFNGLIDEVRIYNRVLSAAEIAERCKT